MRNLVSPDGPEQLLRLCVETLAFGIGANCTHRLQALEAETRFVETKLRDLELAPNRLTYIRNGRPVHLIEAELPGHANDLATLVLVAHTDAAVVFPPEGNGVLGASALLALAEGATRLRLARPVRFVFAVDQELATQPELRVGSALYARTCRERGDELGLVLAIESLAGESPGRPHTFVSDVSQWRYARHVAHAYHSATDRPTRWWPVPGVMQGMASRSVRPFVRVGYPTVATLGCTPFTLLFRDRAQLVDYPKLAAEVQGLLAAVELLAAAE